MIELFDDAVEGAFGGEVANVEFVDDELVEGLDLEFVVVPFEGLFADVDDRVGLLALGDIANLAGIGIGDGGLAVNEELVGVLAGRERLGDVPYAVLIDGHRIGVGVPAVEVPDKADGFLPRGPESEGDLAGGEFVSTEWGGLGDGAFEGGGAFATNGFGHSCNL